MGEREMNLQLGKIQPQSVDTECAILGAIMLEKNALLDIVDILHPETFYDERNGLIFKAILELYNESKPIDLLTVRAQLKKNGKLEVCGGAFYLADLTTKINSGANIEVHSKLIIEMEMKRNLIRLSGDVLEKSFDNTQDVFSLVSDIDIELNEIIENNTKGGFADFKNLLSESVLNLYEMRYVEFTGVPSGFPSLDKITGGWQNTDLIIIAARPAMGKTAFVMNCALNAAKDHNQAVAIFSLEMSTSQLLNRIISGECEIESNRIRKPKSLQDWEWDKINHKTTAIEHLPIFIDDTPNISLIELRAKASRLKRKHDIKLIVIDYLQLMRGSGKGNREQEISEISRGLKTIGKELDLPVIALSQLSRAVESRGGDKRPQLSDLRESGAIEQDADMVGFIYRPEYYGVTELEDGTNIRGKGEIIISKSRHGAIDSVFLNFIGRFTKWTDDTVNNIEVEEIEEPPELKF
jgi:replicative DNA helicase